MKKSTSAASVSAATGKKAADAFSGSEKIGSLMGQGGNTHYPDERPDTVKNLMGQGENAPQDENVAHNLQRIGVLMGQA